MVEGGSVFVDWGSGKKWYDLGSDGCTFTVIEPAAHMIVMLRRIASDRDGYKGKVDPTGRTYTMDPAYVKEHFARCGESKWLANLSVEFTPVPLGAKRGARVQQPYCVLGALAKVFQQAGNTDGARVARADCEESLLAVDRLKFAAGRAVAYGYEARRINAKATEVAAVHPTLLQVSRSHVVAIFDGRIFDAAEAKPLELTLDNLSRCIGAQCDDVAVRGYVFVPTELADTKGNAAAPPAKRPADEAPQDAKRPCFEERVCAACRQVLPKDTFSTRQWKKKADCCCKECLS